MKPYIRTALRGLSVAYLIGAAALVYHEARHGLDAQLGALDKLRDAKRSRVPAEVMAVIDEIRDISPARGELEKARAELNGSLGPADAKAAEATLRRLSTLPDETGIKAKFALAMALIDDQRSASERSTGLVLLKQAADAGEARAEMQMATLLIDGVRLPRNLIEARRHLEHAAKRLPEAALMLSKLYGGESIPSPSSFSRRDLALRIIELLKIDSDSGNVTSTLKLADILSGEETELAEFVPTDFLAAEQLYRAAVDRGSELAVVRLALLLRDKVASAQSREEASALLRKAADSGSGEALLELGKGYRDGLYGEPDLIEAVNFYRRAAESGLSGGMVLLGKAYIYGQGVAIDTKTGLDWMRRAADAGNPAAKVELGIMHRKGLLLQQDDALAFQWFLEGAKAGNASGMAAVAHAYQRGIGIEKNPTEALIWANRAVEGGNRNPDLLSLVGRAYATGEQLPLNTELATRWLTMAAELNNSEAMIELGRLMLLSHRGTPDQAVAWFRRAESLGDAEALMALGRIYASGLGVAVDERRAFEYFHRAAHLGSDNGIREVGNAYAVGFGVPRSSEIALDWFRRAAELGDPEAMLSLYDSYAKGNGVNSNKDAAIGWLRKAAARGNANANYRLGLAYLSGTDIPRDPVAARKHLEFATGLNFAPARLALKTMLGPTSVPAQLPGDQDD